MASKSTISQDGKTSWKPKEGSSEESSAAVDFPKEISDDANTPMQIDGASSTGATFQGQTPIIRELDASSQSQTNYTIYLSIARMTESEIDNYFKSMPRQDFLQFISWCVNQMTKEQVEGLIENCPKFRKAVDGMAVESLMSSHLPEVNQLNSEQRAMYYELAAQKRDS